MEIYKHEYKGETVPTEHLPSKWDVRFMDMAALVGSWSKDPSTKVGAVLVDSRNRVVSHGFNGFAAGVDDDLELYEDKEYKHQVIIHAEENAILFAGRDLSGCTIYTDPLPTCSHCASKIIQAGISRVVSWELEDGKKLKWSDSAELSEEMYRQAGVTFDVYPKPISIEELYQQAHDKLRNR